MVASIFDILQFLPLFGDPRGQMGVKIAHFPENDD